MYPTDITDSQWEVIKKNLDYKIWGRKRKYSIRLIINAILYVTKSGIQWRMLPNDFPDWELVYYYHQSWSSKGIVKQIHNGLALQVRLDSGKEASPSLGLVDSQTVKSMSFTTEKGYDGNKKLLGRKRFIVTDTLGLIMGLVICTADTGERAGALLVFEKIKNQYSRLVKILADQGFTGVEFIENVKNTFGLILEVVSQVLGKGTFQVIPKRWIVERTFGWLAFHRRLTKDYEVKTAHSEAFIYWAMIRIISKKCRGT